MIERQSTPLRVTSFPIPPIHIILIIPIYPPSRLVSGLHSAFGLLLVRSQFAHPRQLRTSSKIWTAGQQDARHLFNKNMWSDPKSFETDDAWACSSQGSGLIRWDVNMEVSYGPTVCKIRYRLSRVKHRYLYVLVLRESNVYHGEAAYLLQTSIPFWRKCPLESKFKWKD